MMLRLGRNRCRGSRAVVSGGDVRMSGIHTKCPR